MVEQRVNLGDLFAKLSPVFEDHYMNVFEVFEVFEVALGQGDCQGGWGAFVGRHLVIRAFEAPARCIGLSVGCSSADGVVVVDVSASSPAAGKLPPQSVILEVNRQAINNLSDFFRVVKTIPDSKSAMVRVYAGGNYEYLIIPGK